VAAVLGLRCVSSLMTCGAVHGSHFTDDLAVETPTWHLWHGSSASYWFGQVYGGLVDVTDAELRWCMGAYGAVAAAFLCLEDNCSSKSW
jgi:hypothetical protein